jgi:hypothetical protein
MLGLGRLVGVTAGLVTLVGWSLAGCGDASEVATEPATQGSGGFTGVGGGGGAGGCMASEELCNGLDDNCDGQVDEGCECTAGETQPCWSGPPDLEGIGTCVGGMQTCDVNGNWGACAGEVLPVTETCDGDDDDCDGEIDEGFGTVTCGLGVCQMTVEECIEGVAQPCIPGAPGVETCDGTDDDCDGAVDEGCSCVDGETQPCYTGSLATKNVGACQDGLQTCANGQWGACQGDITPTAEQCDGVDNDCDGQTDEGNPGGGAMCATGIPGKCAAGTEMCSGGQIVCQQNQQPSPETCNGIDDDCDGQTDESNPGGGGMCSTGLLGICQVGTFNCQNAMLVCTQNQQPTAEQCNGLDDDCDGMTDENNPNGGGACTTTQQGVCAAGTQVCQGGSLVCQSTQMPSAELCNGLDDDCDGSVDENNPGGGGACNTGQLGKCAAGTLNCQNGGLVCTQNQQPSAEVCNGIDDDCDGLVDENNPGGGAACNTNQPGICGPGTFQCQNGSLTCQANQSPGTEQCNGLDDDCDGLVDENNPGGGGACSTGQQGVCGPGTFQCQNGTLTCQGNQSSGPEICDGLDNDCDGAVDEGNPGGGAACNTGLSGICAAGTIACSGGALTCQPNQAPGNEICDGLDNDCDGLVDEGNPGGGGACNTGQLGVCAAGVFACQNGALACQPTQSPSTETCDGLDNNCNGAVDEGNPGGGGSCNTGQPGICAAGTVACQNGSLACQQNQPPSAEVCNGVDDNCDGVIDNGNPGGGAACSTGNLGICAAGTTACQSGALSCVQNQQPTTENCSDGLDNDCDGLVDGADPNCGCSHALCTTGGPLVSGCNQCVTNICAVDPYCCNTGWDSICVNQVRTVCNSLTCPGSHGSCPHPLCQTGPSPFTSGCDSGYGNCVSQICAVDSWCCTNNWDSICAGQVSTVCGKNCNFQ